MSTPELDEGGSSSAASGAKNVKISTKPDEHVADSEPGQKTISVNLNQMGSEEMKQFRVDLESSRHTVEILRQQRVRRKPSTFSASRSSSDEESDLGAGSSKGTSQDEKSDANEDPSISESVSDDRRRGLLDRIRLIWSRWRDVSHTGELYSGLPVGGSSQSVIGRRVPDQGPLLPDSDVKRQQDLQTAAPTSGASSSSLVPSSDEKSDLGAGSSKGTSQDEKSDANEFQDPSYFKSDVFFHRRGEPTYRFRGQGPGVFLCKLTGLGFTMTQEGDLMYEIIQWNDEQLRSTGKLPAGPLFKIWGQTNAVSQLHFQHCEESPDALSSLSVVHISNDGITFLEPVTSNKTHVVVDVSHFSDFGLVIDFFKKMLHIERPIRSQILLFHRPTWTEDRQKVNVFLLPISIPVEEVRSKQENAVYIEATSLCQLMENHTYSLDCPESTLVQPKCSQFDSSFGKVYHPNFEIRLEKTTKDGTVVVKDQDQTSVWEYCMDLTGSGVTTTPSPADAPDCDSGIQNPESHDSEEERKLFAMRIKFIERVSDPVVKDLLDIFLQEKVLSDREKEDIQGKDVRRDRAAALIDTIKRKGAPACKKMIDAFKKIDPYLSETLGLT